MTFFKITALFTALALSAPAVAADLVGAPIVSDGNTAVGLSTVQGVHKVNICQTDYWINDTNSYSIYQSILPRLQNNGGYIYYHTTDSGKRFFSCGWGRYDHLHGTSQ